MANIKLNNNEYPIPDSTLAAPTADFIAHLATIAGNGIRVIVGGVEYNVDPSKVAGAVTEIETVLGGLNTGGDASIAAGLYQTGAIALYEEQGAEAIQGMLIKSWDELISTGVIVNYNGSVYTGSTTPDNMPNKNEYGFYYDVEYFDNYGGTMMFHEDGSLTDSYDGEVGTLPAGSVIYSNNSISIPDEDWSAIVACDGTRLVVDNDMMWLGTRLDIVGDLILTNDNSATIIDGGAFEKSSLTGIIIPDSVTSIGKQAFADSPNLTSVVIGNGVTVLDDCAFGNCVSLTSITIPSGVTSIGEYAFSWCTGLTSITIPDSVTFIDWNVFYGCSALASIIFEGTVAQWNAVEKHDDVLRNDILATYIQCSDGTVSLE